MAKLARQGNAYLKEKCAANANDNEDRISRLPNEILVLILSLLTMKEGGRTSVLSSRWVHLWKFVVGSLDFDGSDMLKSMRMNRRTLTEERSRFIKWVNRVLVFHKESMIDNFRVRFDLNKGAQRNINKWIHFALTKSVKILELDLTPTGFSRKYYDFPQEWLTNVRKYPSYVPWTKSLHSLSLKYINITGDFVEYLISICPLLERLSIVSSKTLVSLKIVGSSIKLTNLNMSSNEYLQSTEINAPNLKSLEYLGKGSTLHIESAPQLIDVYVCSYFGCPITSAVGAISSYFAQIETFTLGIDLLEDNYQFHPLPMLPNLKYLKWIVHACDLRSFMGLLSLIEAAPFLQKFKLELNWMAPRKPRTPVLIDRNFKNEHLKVVKIIGFVGFEIDIELVWFFLQIATKLEMLDISPCRPGKVYGRGPDGWIETAQERAAKLEAEQFRSKLPTCANLVIH